MGEETFYCVNSASSELLGNAPRPPGQRGGAREPRRLLLSPGPPPEGLGGT